MTRDIRPSGSWRDDVPNVTLTSTIHFAETCFGCSRRYDLVRAQKQVSIVVVTPYACSETVVCKHYRKYARAFQRFVLFLFFLLPFFLFLVFLLVSSSCFFVSFFVFYLFQCATEVSCRCQSTRCCPIPDAIMMVVGVVGVVSQLFGVAVTALVLLVVVVVVVVVVVAVVVVILCANTMCFALLAWNVMTGRASDNNNRVYGGMRSEEQKMVGNES